MYKHCLLSFILVCCSLGASVNKYRLKLILGALNDALQYMEDHEHEINLDGVYCIRKVEENLKAYLLFEPEEFKVIRPEVEWLRDKAANISNTGEISVILKWPYELPRIGRMMSRSKRLLWHPSKNTNQNYVESPIPCSRSNYNITMSDICLMESMGSSILKQKSCVISDKCKRQMTSPKERDYFITHQALYWQLSEMADCRHNISPHLMMYLCSNTMRDALNIVRAEIPHKTQDLFMEQIGICGMWGFRDFYKTEWLEKILQWQQPSGCFTRKPLPEDDYLCEDQLVPDGKIRKKRRDFLLEDGCSSHKTGVALMALTVSLRFEAERLYSQITK